MCTRKIVNVVITIHENLFTLIFYRDELQIILRVILNVLDGCDSVLPFWDEPAIKIKPYENCIEQFNPINGVTGEIKMPDGGNVRLFMVKLMTNLQDIMLKNVEDDTKSLTILQMVSSHCLRKFLQY